MRSASFNCSTHATILAILPSKPPKPEVCFGAMGWHICEGLVLTWEAQRDQKHLSQAF